jgi:protein-disulfide isomerase
MIRCVALAVLAGLGLCSAFPWAAQAQVVISVEGAPFKGDENAKLTLIEFTDYESPFCARHARETMPRIEKDYIQTGKVKYVVRNFPVEIIHKSAFRAAEAARCAGEQGKFWEMHARLLAAQKALDPQGLSESAGALGLDVAKFQACLDSGKDAATIRKDLAEAEKVGVRATPTFFFGLTQANGSKITAVRMLRTAEKFSAFQQAIDGMLTEQK